MLLAGAGLLLRTLIAVETFDRGYRATQVLTMYVDPIGSRYPTPQSLLQFYDAVRRGPRRSGVATVAWASQLPLTAEDARDVTFEVVGDPAVDERQRPAADSHTVSPSTSRPSTCQSSPGAASPTATPSTAAGVPRQRSPRPRPPAGSAGAGHAPRDAARVLTAGGGLRVRDRRRGAAGRGRPDEREAFVQVYRPMGQRPNDDIYLVVRAATGEAAALTAAVRGAIARVDRDQLVGVRDIRTLEDVAWTATERHRFRAVLVVTFAGLALTLAMVGVFGIVGCAVQQRLRDFAVRRALGASAATSCVS